MNFAYVHEHPWITTAAILGGGFVLFLILHKRQSAASDGTVVYAGGAAAGGVDPTVQAQIDAQTAQTQAQLSALSLQGQYQLATAQIAAGIQSQTIAASQEVQDRQTDAQKDLGMGTLGAQVQLAQINADTTMAYINAIVSAFRGTSTPVSSTPVSNSPQNPVNVVNQPASTINDAWWGDTSNILTGGGSSGVNSGGAGAAGPAYDGSETSYFQSHPTATWSQYYADYQAAHGYTAGTSYDPAAVAAQTAGWAAAYEQWKADPYSPRNTVPTGWVNS